MAYFIGQSRIDALEGLAEWIVAQDDTALAMAGLSKDILERVQQLQRDKRDLLAQQERDRNEAMAIDLARDF